VTIEATLDCAAESLGAGRYWDALALVNEVVPGATGRSRRRARVLKAQALLRGEGGRRAAEDELKAALEEDPANVEAHFFLGTIYKAGRANALAAAAFRRVLVLKPRHSRALAELASLEAAPEAPKVAGLRGLFGRS
jgi:Tfp pilus assembly protein PilF